MDSDLLETLATPAAPPACAACGKPFDQRQGSGGKIQRFCSAACRQAHHRAERANVTAEIPNVTPNVTPNVSDKPSEPEQKSEQNSAPDEDDEASWPFCSDMLAALALGAISVERMGSRIFIYQHDFSGRYVSIVLSTADAHSVATRILMAAGTNHVVAHRHDVDPERPNSKL
jgi:hypothetical protein